VIETTGFCSKCHKIWTLDTTSGVCRWCGKLSTSQSSTGKPRSIKSRSSGGKRQDNHNGNGYDQLPEPYLTYYKVGEPFSHKAQAQEIEDLLHTIIANLADAGRNNGHKPDNASWMYRIASFTVCQYWRNHYRHTNGLDCGHCSKAQKQKCRDDDLYSQCPKLIKLESLDKPILDSEGNLTELGDLIVDDKAIDLDGWVSDSTWEVGYPHRLVDIAYKLKGGYPLTNADMIYLCRYRKQEQKRLL